jgi:FAD dependent oxidoreductase TIGR03364
MSKKKAIVVGAGIVGLATARALAEKGYKVKVFERNERAVGASIRNFGMVWPIGQPKGKLFERAIRTRQIWLEICTKGNIWHNPSGSLHLLYHDDELAVATEFLEANSDERGCYFLSPKETLARSLFAKKQGLKGALWSNSELIVESRDAMWQLPNYLEEKYDITFHFGKAVSKVKSEKLYVNTKKYDADLIVICSGADFESLYPEVFAKSGITKCKLQMMRSEPLPKKLDIGPSLCSGLTLTHYGAFAEMRALPKLKKRFEKEWPEQLKWGVHVLVSQSPNFELTLGDSHEYGLVFDPFNKAHINKLVLDYLQTFTTFKTIGIAQTWNGIYAKLPGKTEFIAEPDKGVHILNGLSGAGMTLSFGLAEEWADGL